MNASPAPGSQQPSPSGPDNHIMERWATLLAEMSALHAQLEYTRLMLRLGARQDTDR